MTINDRPVRTVMTSASRTVSASILGTEWQEGGWMFTQPNGKPIDPRRDEYE